MKIIYKIIRIVLGVIILQSCSIGIRSTTVKTTDIYGPGVIQKPVLADLDVKDVKIRGTAEGGSELSLENVKNFAVANALEEAKADVLVDPKFETFIKENKKKVDVIGFPVKYKNFRTIKQEDLSLLKVDNIHIENENTPGLIMKQKKISPLSAIGTVLILGGLLALAAILPMK